MGQHLHSDFKIRIPDDLKEKIRQSAEDFNRSMTADIVARLEASFDDEATTGQGTGVNLQFDSEWFKKTGLTADEFAHYVRLSVLNGLTDNKNKE